MIPEGWVPLSTYARVLIDRGSGDCTIPVFPSLIIAVAEALGKLCTGDRDARAARQSNYPTCSELRIHLLGLIGLLAIAR